MSYTFSTALVRRPCEAFGQGLTTAAMGPPDFAIMCGQHDAYVAALRAVGLRVVVLEPLPDCPDAHFVEDGAVILPEVVVSARPGAASRRSEAAHTLDALVAHGIVRGSDGAAAVARVRDGADTTRTDRVLARIEPPGTLDGGDVLVIDRAVFVGISSRTNERGARQLAETLEPFRYVTHAIEVGAGLHLKSAVNVVGPDTVLGWRDVIDRPEFDHYERIEVDPREAYAANCLRVNDVVFAPSEYPGVARSLAERGLQLETLDMSESQKMDGGLTCLSLRF